MKTRHITTTYAYGYTLAQIYKAIDIEASGMIENGLTLTGGRDVTVTDDGTVAGANGRYRVEGGAGLTLVGSARLGGAGRITGGDGGYSAGGGAGGGGGAGVSMAANAKLEMAAGTITGGAGGNNQDHSGFGGVGGAGVYMVYGSKLNVTAGTITGGMGGYAYGVGGAGGVGVYLAAAAILKTIGTIAGGAGGGGNSAGAGGTGVSLASGARLWATGMIMGGAGGISYGEGGAGGTGVYLAAGSIPRITDATITGGRGGGSAYSQGGAGGTGVSLAAGAILTTAGTITGGGGGQGFSDDSRAGEGGTGAVLAAGAIMKATGTIIGGAGGYGSEGGAEGGAGVSVASRATLRVTGRITGGAGGDGYYGGGDGGEGVYLSGTSFVMTDGTIIGGVGGNGGAGGSGVVMAAATGANVTNGDATHHAALIEGATGVTIAGVATVTNFATIQGTGGTSVAFSESGDRLIVEVSAVFVGAAEGGGGTVELAGGTGTITGLGATGTLSGADAMTFSGFGSYQIDAGDVWTLTGKNTSNERLANAGTLIVAANASLNVQGAVDNSGTISLAKSGLIVGVTGATLSGTGSVILGRDAIITGASVVAKFTNGDDTVSGAGQIGAGKMTLVNERNGVIDQTGSTGLTIDTGTEAITNAGTIEATGAGGLTIAGAIFLTNSGLLEANGGSLILDGAVSGAGSAVIDTGTLTAASTFTQNVAFGVRMTGRLILADSTSYTGTISGFSNVGETSLDLRDIGFVGSNEATFSGGVLTVTDGTHTAKIALAGNHATATFTASSDGDGGTIVIATKPQAPVQGFVAAMAWLGGSAGEALHAGGAPSLHTGVLTTPRIQLA